MAGLGHLQININSSSCIQFKQLNLAKSKLASANFAQKFSSWSRSCLVAFLQEPAVTTSGRLQGVPPGAQSFAAAKPRVAVVATADLSLWPLPDLTCQDAAAVLWRTNDRRFPEIVLASVYADITKPAVPKVMADITSFCSGRDLPCIIGIDTNAHSALWGSDTNNSRGDAFELFIMTNSLSVMNVGAKPTFCTSRGASIIDVTLASDNLVSLLEGWNVSGEDFCSDHRLIAFQLNIAPPALAPVKNYQRTDWSQTTMSLQYKCSVWKAPRRWSEQILDAEAASFATLITSTVDANTPIFVPKSRLRQCYWWNEDLARLRRDVKSAYRKHDATKTREAWQAVIEARAAMRRAVRKAKLQSWQEFCSAAGSFEEGSPKALSRLSKILHRTANNQLGLVRQPDGSMTDTPEAAINTLLQEHFPGSYVAGDLVQDISPVELKQDYYSWLTDWSMAFWP